MAYISHLILLSLVFYQSVSSITLTTCPGFETNTRAKRILPKLNFSSNANLSLMKNGITIKEIKDTIFINRTGKVYEIRLDCWAPYPIDLTFSGHVTNQDVQVRTFVNPFKDKNGTKKYCYHVNLTMDMNEQIVGNYSCFDVFNPSNEKSKYLYLFSEPPSALLRRGQNITKVVESNQKSIVLDCAVSNPEVKVELIKDDKVISASNAFYDSKVGFKLLIPERNPESVLGDYKCQTALSPMDSIHFHLVSPPELNVQPNIKVVQVKLGDQLRLTCMAQVELNLIISNPNITKQGVILNGLLNNDQQNNYRYIAEYLVESFSETVHGDIKCMRKLDNYTVHKWIVNVAKHEPIVYKRHNHTFTAVGRFGLLDMSLFLESCPRVNGNGRRDLVMFECNNWIECQINRCRDKDNYCQPNNDCSSWQCIPNGIVQCSTRSIAGVATTASQIFFQGIDTGGRYSDSNNIITTWKYDILKMTAERQILSIIAQASKTINIFCRGTNFVVSGGFEWYLEFNNGTLNELSEQYAKYQNYDFTISETYDKSRAVLKSGLSISETILMSKEVKYVMCSAPIWNSTNWISDKMLLQDIKSELGLELRVELRGYSSKNSSSSSSLALRFWLAVFNYCIVWVFTTNLT